MNIRGYIPTAGMQTKAEVIKPLQGIGSFLGASHVGEKSGIALFLGVDLRLSPTGSAMFDYHGDNGEEVCPRTVDEMHVYSEQGGTSDQHIVLKVSDRASGNSIWVRFRAYHTLGEHTRSAKCPVPPDSALRVSLMFETGIAYKDVINTHQKVLKLCQGLQAKHKIPHATNVLCEKLSLHIGSGVGLCSPQDLCEIWPAMPNCDRRMQAVYWYETNDDSGIEFIVMHVVGSSDYTSAQNWWVQLERDGASDMTRISTNRALVTSSRTSAIPNEAKLAREFVFEYGIPFAQVIKILRDIPPGFSFATEDCWYYASTLAHRLSTEVGDDLFECPTADLWEIWSGNRGAHQIVNQMQLYEDEDESVSDYLILNLPAWLDDTYGLWVRLSQVPQIDGDIDMATVTRNRRRLIRSSSTMRADVNFNGLELGKVVQTMKKIKKHMEDMDPSSARQVSKPASAIKALTEVRGIECYWIEGSCSNFSSLSTVDVSSSQPF